MLARAGVPEEAARGAADVLLWASLRGVDTHGIRNLKRYYADGLTAGTIVADAVLRVESETAATAAVDAGSGLGLWTGRRAMEIALEKAAEAGLGMVTVRNSQHFGAAGYFAHMAVARDMIGLAATGYFFANGQEKSVVPFGGLWPMLSTNPLAVACPGEQTADFVLDMSTSVVPVNRLEMLQELGRRIPLGWGLDADGQETDDPTAVQRLLPLGGMEALGGHKGFGLAVAVQCLTGVLSGGWKTDADPALVLGDRREPVADHAQEGVSHVFAAVRIDRFTDVGRFKRGMDAMAEAMHACPPAEGHERVTLPGEREAETERERLRDGIPLSASVVGDLKELSQQFDVPLELVGE